MFRSPLAVALLVALAPAGVTLAQDAAPARATTLDTLIVTGTRVADRTVAESQSPIDILTPETLTATGTPELATALSRALPSLNFPRPAINDGTDAVRPAQIRGLSPDHVLVLVNGKRYHSGALVNVNGSQGRSSSPVDLNTIPISAIERVEVLRDGASAQYGSDAIAGVINIVLKGRAGSGGVSGRYGQYSAGDGAQYQLLADAGFTVLEPKDSHICCGSAGTYNLMQPAISAELKSRKVSTLEAICPQVISAGNIGCMMQIGSGTGVPVVHTAELLDWATGGPRPRALSEALA